MARASSGFPVNPHIERVRRPRRRVRRSASEMEAQPSLARLRDRRRRREGRRSRPARRDGHHVARAALGDRVQVPARGEDDGAPRHHGEHRPHRSRDAVRGARAGVRRRRERRHGHAAQRGRRRAQGRAARRHRDRAPGRRRDPRGRRAGARQAAASARGGGSSPTKCPVCGEPLVRLEGEANHHCVNVDCPAQRVQRIVHFAGRGAMDIEGLGEERVRQFVDAGLLAGRGRHLRRSPSSSSSRSSASANASAQLLVDAIEASKPRPLWRAARRARHQPRRADRGAGARAQLRPTSTRSRTRPRKSSPRSTVSAR